MLAQQRAGEDERAEDEYGDRDGAARPLLGDADAADVGDLVGGAAELRDGRGDPYVAGFEKQLLRHRRSTSGFTTLVGVPAA